MIPVTEHNKTDLFNQIAELPGDGSYCVEIKKVKKRRTPKQNACLHLWLRQMSTAMNDAGQSVKIFMQHTRNGFDIPVTMEFLKEVANEVSVGRYGRTTSKLSTVEVQELYEILNRAFGETTGVSLPWPHEEVPIEIQGQR